MSRLYWAAVVAALVTVVCVFGGCSGSGSGGPVVPPPGPTFGTVEGQVVRADNLNAVIANAVVAVEAAGGGQGASVSTDNLGRFRLTNVPAGQITLLVDTPGESNYGSQRIPGVPVPENATTTLAVTVMRVDQETPTAVQLSPAQASVDLNGEVQFNAQVNSSRGRISITPTFILSNDLGTITANGVFRGTQTGAATLRAVIGNISASAQITVTGARDPEISSVIISPLELSASGGTVNVTAAVNDGDGIDTCTVQISTPDGTIINRPMSLDSGTIRDGTYRLVGGYRLPPNSNVPDANGRQAPQRYSFRIIAKDLSGAESFSSFTDVTVRGVDMPPAPF